MKQQFRYQTSVKSCRVATEFAAYFKLMLKNSLPFSSHFLFLLFSLPQLFVSFVRSYLSFSIFILSFVRISFTVSSLCGAYITYLKNAKCIKKILFLRPGKKIPLKKPKCRWYFTAKLILKL